MSISATSCHYYRALDVAGETASPTVASVFLWMKPNSAGEVGRVLFAADSGDDWASERRRIGISQNGGNEQCAWVQTSLGTSVVQANTSMALWESQHLDRWMGSAMWIDLPASGADCASIVGRAVATAVAANAGSASVDLGNLTGVTLNDFYVHRKMDPMNASGSDVENTTPIAHIAYWVGHKLTVAEVQSMIDGTNPQDIAPTYLKHYWPLRNSTDGLVDVIGGVTLVPVGGSATTTYHASDNPTVNDPTGSSQLVTVANVAQANTVTGAAVYQAPPNGILTTAPLKNNARTLLANISGWTVDVKNPTTGALVVRVTGLTTSALGVLTVQDALIITGQSYALDPIHETYGRVTPVLTAT